MSSNPLAFVRQAVAATVQVVGYWSLPHQAPLSLPVLHALSLGAVASGALLSFAALSFGPVAFVAALVPSALLCAGGLAFLASMEEQHMLWRTRPHGWKV